MKNEKTIKGQLAKLVDVKSILTLLLTLLFCFSVVTKTVTGEQMQDIYQLVIAFYFGTQATKATNKEEK